MKKNAFVALSLAAVISLTPAFTTNASADINKDIQAKSSKIDNLKSKKAELQGTLSKLITKIEKAKENAKALQVKFDKTSKELKKLNKEIKVINERIQERQEVLKERARAMQKTSNSNTYVDIILNSEDLSDLINRVSAVNQLVSSDKSILEEQQKDVNDLKTKQNTVKEKQAEQQTAIQKYEEEQNNIESQKAKKEVLVTTLAAEQAKAETEKSGLVSKRNKLAKAAEAKAKAAEKKAKELEAATKVVATTAENDSDNSKAVTKTSNDTNTSSKASKASSDNNSTASSSNSSSSKSSSSDNDNGDTSSSKPSGSGYSAMISDAKAQLGKSYSIGATGPSAYDCSGFTQHAFRAAGISLPRTSGAQYGSSKKISASQAKPGDLVFFSYGGGIAHVGIYVGGGTMINAQNDGVKYDNITSGYWAKHLVGYGRVANF